MRAIDTVLIGGVILFFIGIGIIGIGLTKGGPSGDFLADNTSQANLETANIMQLIGDSFNQSISSIKTSSESDNQSSGTVITVSPCTPNWQCGTWSECSSYGSQSRICTDASTCGVTSNKPSEAQSCTPPYVAFCGSGICDAGESYSTCPQDCSQKICTAQGDQSWFVSAQNTSFITYTGSWTIVPSDNPYRTLAYTSQVGDKLFLTFEGWAVGLAINNTYFPEASVNISIDGANPRNYVFHYTGPGENVDIIDIKELSSNRIDNRINGLHTVELTLNSGRVNVISFIFNTMENTTYNC